MAAYTDPTKMAAYLGVAFTVDQTTVATRVASAVTTWIDRRTGTSWQNVTGTVVDEIHQISNGVIFLTYVPVIAVTQLETRVRGGSNPWQVLPPDQYTLADPAEGRVDITGLSGLALPAYDARADYTNAVTAPPDDILLAATVLASYFMTSSLRPGTAGLSSLAVGQNDISLAFASGAASAQSADLAAAVKIVDSYRTPVIA